MNTLSMFLTYHDNGLFYDDNIIKVITNEHQMIIYLVAGLIVCLGIILCIFSLVSLSDGENTFSFVLAGILIVILGSGLFYYGAHKVGEYEIIVNPYASFNQVEQYFTLVKQIDKNEWSAFYNKSYIDYFNTPVTTEEEETKEE